MKYAVRNISLVLLIVSATIPALYAYQAAAAPSEEHVYVMTNNPNKNEILAFERNSVGRLHSTGRYETGGRGSGGTTDPLGSQGSLTLSQDHHLLLAVNAGSGTVSSFYITDDKLHLVDQQPTDGAEPVAVAQHGGFVYVLDQGGNGSVTVFRVDTDGHLKKIPKSTVLLSATNAGAGSIAVSPDGQFVAVTEKLTNNIDTFRVFPDGTLSPITSTPDKNPGAFSAIFSKSGQLLVSETGPANAADGSTISSFNINSNAGIAPISSGVPTYGGANCWLVLTPNGKWVYTSNSRSNTISGFNVATNGTLTPIGSTVVGSNPPGSTNLDIAVSADGKFVYTLNSSTGTIGVFSVQSNGTLWKTRAFPGFAKEAGFNGLAAY